MQRLYMQRLYHKRMAATRPRMGGDVADKGGFQTRPYMGGNPRGDARGMSPHRRLLTLFRRSLTRGYGNPAFHAGRKGGCERRQGGFETRPYMVVGRYFYIIPHTSYIIHRRAYAIRPYAVIRNW
jgi:hypothetical protein